MHAPKSKMGCWGRLQGSDTLLTQSVECKKSCEVCINLKELCLQLTFTWQLFAVRQL